MIYTLAMGRGQGRRAALAAATLEMLTLGVVFMIMTFAIFALYGLFAGLARRWILASKRTMRWLNRGFAGVFALLAGRLALERA